MNCKVIKISFFPKFDVQLVRNIESQRGRNEQYILLFVDFRIIHSFHLKINNKSINQYYNSP